MIRVLTLLAALLLASPALARIGGDGQLWGLVIGIERYQSQGGSLPDLRGAVNDARDIASALRQAGAAGVTLLIDEAAQRDAIFAAIDDLAARASPGDTIVISYAGHGGQEPTTDLSAEPDGQTEVTLLGGFGTSAPRNYQRILDREWRDRVSRLSDFTVVMVFDTCHSGSANRDTALSGGYSSTRFAQYGPITEDQVPPARHDASRIPAVLDHEVYLGATRDDLVVPEIPVGDDWRGALSLAFAQALRGHADADGDGVLSRGELTDFIAGNVRTLSSARQFPQVVYPGLGTPQGDARPLLGRGALPGAAVETVDACTAAALAAAPARLAVRVDPLARQTSAAVMALAQVQEVSAGQPAGLTLLADGGTNRLLAYGPTGDVAAEFTALSGRPLSMEDAGALVERWRMATVLDLLAGCAAPLPATLIGPRGEGALHRLSEILTLTVLPRDAAYLTMIAINGAGGVELLYPTDRDPETVDPAHPLQQEFQVTEPFGTDLLIVLASDAPQSALIRRLRQFDPRRNATHPSLLAVGLAQALATGRHRLAVLAVHTAAR